MKRVVHPSGRALLFEPKFHKYTMEGVGQLKSVSKVLDKHFPFDDKKLSELVANKTGKTPEEVKALWRRQAVLGSNIHALIEARLLNKPPEPISDLHGEEALYSPVAKAAVEKVLENYDTVGVEHMVASSELGIAGTIDFLGRNKKTGALLVADWKTTGSTLSNFRFSHFETPATGALGHLPNGKFCRYGLQIMIYGYLLRKEGYEKIYGKEVLDRPLEFGIIQMGKDESGKSVSVQFKRVTPQMVLPVDMTMEWSLDDMLRRIIVNS